MMASSAPAPNRRRARWATAFASMCLAVAAFVAACEAPPLDDFLAGKSCSASGACAEGFVCDASTQLCVKPGTSTASSSSTGYDGTCITVVDCPPTENHCVTAICVGGLCGTSATVMGIDSGLAVPHDCKASLCDGAGHAVDVNDDTDLPEAATCKTPVCDGGAAVTRPVPAGTACTDNGGALCNAASECVECLSEADCTGLPPTDECQQRICTPEGHCTQSFTPVDTAVAAQNAGDCNVFVCDGAGMVVPKPLTTDAPDDGNDCTTQACNPDGTVELENVAMNQGCMAGVCDGAGHCTGCVSPANCGSDTFCATWTCDTGICNHHFTADNTILPSGQQVSGDCQRLQCNGSGGVVTVESDIDVPADDGVQCTDESCESGSPQHPPSAFDDTCNQSGGSVCDGGGNCVECNTPGECANQGGICAHATCSSHTCGLLDTPNNIPAPVGAQTTGDCKRLICDGSGHANDQNDDGDLPLDNDDCTLDTCTAGVPDNPDAPDGTPCGTDGFCDGSGTCSTKKVLGDPCTLDGECDSGHCPSGDGVCCASTCGATCRACTFAKTGVTTGTCAPIPVGQDPDAECMTAGQSCNGANACAFLCGQTPSPPGGSCPAACTGGCSAGVCLVDCNGAASCGASSITCPPGFACKVLCDDLGACDNATVTCPDAYACTMVCSNGACASANLGCGSGVCSLACAGAGSCVGANVGCGQNTCSASCSGGSADPTVSCGGSCDCNACP